MIGRNLWINEVRIWLGFVSQIIFIYIFNQLCAMYIKAKVFEPAGYDVRHSISSYTNESKSSINSYITNGDAAPVQRNEDE
jgi:hypothetical protein